ncbi:sulfurtransferase TusA family protein [Sulfurisphaera ohwakuensis]|uniref:sulfurtransferase TusA family protein n=1 Tax=Sulfurisphaera ohwakuensis TaxID=69656 RepID=UPI0036F281FC
MMELKLSNPITLIDIEKFYKLYCLKSLKKLDWGYEGEIELLRLLKFSCFIVKKIDRIDIFDKNGKFKIYIEFSSDKIKISGQGDKLIVNSIINRIAKNIEKYGASIVKYVGVQYSRDNKTVLFKTVPDEILDLRGYSCPVPEIKTKQKLLKMEKGKVLEVLIDNPAAIEYTLPEVARLFNCRYEIYNMGDYASFVFIKLDNTRTYTNYTEVVEEVKENEIKELIKESDFRAFLYSYFDQIVEQRKAMQLQLEDIKYQGYTVISAAPIGRGWLFTALVNGDNIIAARLDVENNSFYNEDALKRLPIEGECNIFYLKHKERTD